MAATTSSVCQMMVGLRRNAVEKDDGVGDLEFLEQSAPRPECVSGGNAILPVRTEEDVAGGGAKPIRDAYIREILVRTRVAD